MINVIVYVNTINNKILKNVILIVNQNVNIKYCIIWHVNNAIDYVKKEKNKILINIVSVVLNVHIMLNIFLDVINVIDHVNTIIINMIILLENVMNVVFIVNINNLKI